MTECFSIRFCVFIFFNGETLLLYSVSTESIAEVWAYFPDYSLELLYRKISQIVKNNNTHTYREDDKIELISEFKVLKILLEQIM